MLETGLATILALSLGLNLVFMRSSRGWLRVLLAFTWFFSSCLYKVALTHYLLDAKVEIERYDWAWNAVNVGLLAVLGLLLAGRRYLLLWWATVAFLACLFWFDLLYHRFFDDIPGLYLLTGLSQGASSWPSAWAMHKTADLGLFFDLPIMALAILIGRPDRSPVSRRAAFPLLVLLLLLDAWGCYTINEDRSTLLRLRFKNIAIVQELGLLNYHLYDLAQHIDPRLRNPLKTWTDEDLLKQVISSSRRSIDAPSPVKGSQKGRNLMMIQLESLQDFPVNLQVGKEKVMPYLSSLLSTCLYAALQDQTGQGRSSDGEFVMLNSLLPPGERPLVFAFPDNDYYGLPAILAEHGYHTTYAVPYLGSFWNCRYMSGRYGFQKDWLKDDFSEPEDGEEIGWGLTDEALYKRIIPRLTAEQRPFMLYLVTLMGHHPYKELEPEQELLHLPHRLQKTMLGRYLQECRLRDEQLKKLVDYMQFSGLWDNTVLVMFGDHDARIPDEDMRQLKNPHFDEVDSTLNDRVAFIVHCPGDKPKGRLEGLRGQVDAAPTLLHLLGIPSGQSAFLGLNMFAPERHKLLVSKGGYGLDDQKVVIDEGTEMTGYRRSDHNQCSAAALEHETRRQLELALDILRLNLVPKIKARKY